MEFQGMAKQREELTTARRGLGEGVRLLKGLGRTLGVAVALSLASAMALEAATVTLAWDRNSETNIGGYILYYGTVPGQYSGSIAVGNVAQYVFTEPVNGPTYFFALQAVNTAGLGGGLSGEVNNAARPLADVLFDNGARGIWELTDGADYRQINPGNPTAMVTGDLDGNGVGEVIADFGPGLGIWIRWNGTTWTQLNPISAAGMVTGDLDNNGRDDLVVSFPGAGVWVLWNGATWQQLHVANPTRMVIGHIEGGPPALILDYPGRGIWIRHSASGTWSQLHSQNSTAMAVGDFDGNGYDDIAIAFEGAGVWLFMNGSSWQQTTSLQASKLAAGSVDGTAAAVLLGDFAPAGLWMLRNTVSWSMLHSFATKQFLFADVDGDGRDEIMVDFGDVLGSWIWSNYSGWRLGTADSPEAFIAGSLN
jgi:hypothetical protein